MNHLGNANKMVETPRTDAAEKHAYQFKDEWTPVCESKFVRQLERELNRACEMYRKLDIHALNLVDRIRRLEEAGDRMEKLMPDGNICDKAANAWREAKEAKP